jgi:PAS domain S-box-containing protein
MKAAVKRQEIELLSRAFASFNQSTRDLKESYDFLQKKLKRLNWQLERKNKELELSLKEKEGTKNFLKNILDSLTVGVVVVNLDQEIVVFNRESERITGFVSKKVIRKNFYRFFNDLLQLEPPLGEKEVFANETKEMKKKDEPLFVSLNSTHLKNSDGEIIGKIVILQDITRLKKLEEQAERRNSLTAMGELAVDIAHEIRNPLGSIEIFASLLKRDLKDNQESLRLAEHISSSVKSLNCILSNLLLFTKTQKPVFKIIDLHEFLKENISFISYILKQNNICFKKSFSKNDFFIKGDEELLKQVFLNLTLNAIQAMPKGGTLKISTRGVDDELGILCKKSGITREKIFGSGPGFVEVKFQDTGTGIPEGYIKSIFNPFFTTREKGTGLGLAIVHNIVESHQGMITVRSEERKGAEFSLMFPVDEAWCKESGTVENHKSFCEIDSGKEI